MQYWLMKSEPSTFSIDDLEQARQQTEPWDGIRNYQVRNMLRDQMQVGDQAFFYHSSCKVPGIVGLMEVVRAGYPDHTAFAPDNAHYDPKSDPEHPRWFMVDVRYLRHTRRVITLAELREQNALASLPLLRRGNRLSIVPVEPEQWQCILELE
jgi:predicted RNA-binding protein with PUA-like domain